MRHKQQAFFGRRKTKTLSKHQQQLVDVLLPKLLLDINKPISKIDDIFTTKKTCYILEIGFGGGEHLAHLARQNSDIGFIGAEPFVNGIAKILCEIENDNLQNIKIYNDDAIYLLDYLPDNCLSKIYLLYPDPWPKKRNWKRRFVNNENLNRLARVLVPNGSLIFASDIDDYIEWTLFEIDKNKKFACQYNSTTPPQNWHPTRYEKKALKAASEKRTPHYLQFAKI